MKRLALAALSVLALCSLAVPAQANTLTGPWFCTMTSSPATVRMNVMVRPDQTLIAQGEVILNGTSGHYRFNHAPGRWSVSRNTDGQLLVWMQVMPPNFAVFSIHPGIVTNPNVLLSRFQDPQNGTMVETACRRGFG